MDLKTYELHNNMHDEGHTPKAFSHIQERNKRIISNK